MLATRRLRPWPVLSSPQDLLPEGFGVRLDPEARRSGDGRTLRGGSPLRLLRLSEHAANLLAALAAGAPAASRPARQLARRLCEVGLAHPAPPPGGPSASEATCVVPVRDDPEGLAALLASLASNPPSPTGATVVEDGSRHPAAVASAARRGGARLIQRAAARGPAAARNAGWQATDAPILVFLDADVEVTPSWLAPLLAHFADPSLAAVAPRVRAPASATDLLGRFEREASPLDMGALPSLVGPRRRVPYVPSAALLVRRAALAELGGFDERLRLGEDVDFVWRAVAAGWTVRYEPSVEVIHRNRPSWPRLASQRYRYGTSAAPLAARHPGDAVPLEIAPWSLAAWLAVALAGRRGASTAAVLAARRAGKLRQSLAVSGTSPLAGTAQLVMRHHLASGGRLAAALRRTWLPLLLVAARWRWGRRLAVAALILEPLASWAARRPPVGPLRWIVATLLADAAYCAGVWRGAGAARSAAALRPRLSRTPSEG